MSSQPEVIETTVSKVAAELARRGLDPDDRVTITIEPDELIPAGARRGHASSPPVLPMTTLTA